jgi:hypothetical protein
MRYGTDVDNAIREAFAAGLRYSDAFRKLKAGTLDGVGPTAMPERTFAYKWRIAKREQQSARGCSQRPWPSYWNVLRMVAMLGESGIRLSHPAQLSPEQIADAIDWPVRCVAALLARREAHATHAPAPTGPPPDETERERELEEDPFANWPGLPPRAVGQSEQ